MLLEDQLKQTREATLSRMPHHIVQTFFDSLNILKEDKLKENALQLGDSIPNEVLEDSLNGNSVTLTRIIH